MKKKTQLINQLRHIEKASISSKCTRREFVQYSTFALVAAAMPMSMIGCSSGGGGNNDSPELNSFDQSSVTPGDILGIKYTESPGITEIPEDIYSISVRTGDNVTYGLRPIYFKEGWVGVAIPPMIQTDGSYFETINADATFTVRGTKHGESKVTVTQTLSQTTDGELLLSLINDVIAELASINDERNILFEEAALLLKWELMYPLVSDGLTWLSDVISSVNSDPVTEVTTIGGDTCIITQQDIALAELMIENSAVYDAEGMANAFFDGMPEASSTLIKKLTLLIGYVVPGAFVSMTRAWADTTSGKGAISAILTVAVPAACMCVVGNCLRKMAESGASVAYLIHGINWYANTLINQGLYALNDEMVCEYQNDTDEIIKLITTDSIDLLDDISESLLGDIPWSNSTPWSNGSPWSNNAQWNNTVWTNQPWNNTPWNNSTPWSNNIWSNNVWSNNTPWSNNTWSNNTPWSNNTWSNNPPWNNNTWNNFVNSGNPVTNT